MKILEIDTENRRQVRDFLDLPFRIYADCPQWVPPLEMDARRMLDRTHHPFFKHSDAAFFLASDTNGQILGRVAVLDNQHYNEYNHEKTAFFYLFECVNEVNTCQGLFDAVFNWARNRGLANINGP